MGGEFIGPYAEKKRKNPKSYGPRLISDKEEKEILEAVGITQQEEEYQPPKKPITGDSSNLIVAGTNTTTTARRKVKDILTGSGIT